VLVRPGLSWACFSCSLVGGAFFRYEGSLRSGMPCSLMSGAFFWGAASSPSGVVLGWISFASFWSEGSPCTLSMRAAAVHELGESVSMVACWAQRRSGGAQRRRGRSAQRRRGRSAEVARRCMKECGSGGGGTVAARQWLRGGGA